MSVLGSVAAAVTYFFTQSPQAALWAYSIGSGVEAMTKGSEGPRLEDLKVQLSSYGAPIPFEWGINRHAGTIIWPKEIVLVEHERSESAKGGGDITTYSYTCSCAVLICEGPIAGVRRIWANKKLVYDASATNTGPQKDPAINGMRIYLGTETQQVDPLIEATDGPSPAYLGYAYIVFEDYDLSDAGNRPPQWEFEVVTAANGDIPPPVEYGNGDMMARDPVTGYLWAVDTDAALVRVYDPVAQTVVTSIALSGETIGGPAPYGIVYNNGYMVIGNSAPNFYDTMGWQVNTATYLPEIVHASYSAYFWPGIPTTSGIFFGAGGLAGGMSWNTRTNSLGPSASGYVANVALSPDGTTEVLLGLNRWIAWGVHDEYIEFQVANLDWPDFPFSDGHLIAFDDARNVMYWGNNGNTGVYAIDRATGVGYLAIPDVMPRAVLYDPDADRLYINVAGGFAAYQPIDAPSAPLGGFGDDDWNPVNYFDLIETFEGMGNLPLTDHISMAYLGNGEFAWSGGGHLYSIKFNPSLEPEQVILKDIVADICARADLVAADIDVEQLTDLVDGYIVPRQMTARDAIEPLQKAYFFDAVESDNKLKFVKRGGSVVATIPENDRAAHECGSEIPDNLTITRAQELELPVQVDVEYPDIDADHLVGNQYDRRITKDTKHKLNIQLPVVMNAAKAKQVAIVNLYQAWQTQTFAFRTTRKYAYLEPTDIVALPTDAATYVARITAKREQPNGVIEWGAQIEAVEVYTQSGDNAAPTNYVPQTIRDPGTTVLQLLDIPILRDADDDPGFYVAMAGTATGWRGAQLYKSIDDGSTYDAALSVSESALIGTASSVLPDFSGGNLFDESSTVTVVMQTGATLTSATETQVLNGANAAVIGAPGRWEVIQYKTATLTATNTYRLSGLLRGRRGTEWATGTHALNDKFVVISTSAWRRIDDGDIGLERLFKAPPFGVALSTVTATSFTNTAVGLLPYSPVLLGGGFDASGNVTLHWTRRARLSGEWRSLVDVPVSEAAEAYEVEIYDSDFTTLKRTITGLTAPTATYTAAEQTTDFGAPQSTIYFRVYQLSATVGRGYGAQGTAPATDTVALELS